MFNSNTGTWECDKYVNMARYFQYKGLLVSLLVVIPLNACSKERRGGQEKLHGQLFRWRGDNEKGYYRALLLAVGSHRCFIGRGSHRQLDL